MQFFAVLLSTVALAVSTTATPLRVAERSELIVYAPPITQPQGGAVWPIGTTQTVCWDSSNPPPGTQDATGTLYLGYLANQSENLKIDNPLARGFPLSDGCVDVYVPDVAPADNYIVSLVGDSANISGSFSIVAPPE